MPDLPIKHPGGRPTKYNDKVLAHAWSYVNRYKGYKVRIPYVEELALELDIDDDTLVEWMRLHKEFSAAIKALKMLQRLRLLGETIKPYPTGAIFQLKANHNMIETEKKILQGGAPGTDPIQIIVTEEKR